MRGLHRSGAVVGISGGIDSSVCLALCRQGVRPRARGAAPAAREGFGPGVGGPGARPGRPLRRHPHPGDITPALDGFGCYARRDEAIARVFPEYDAAAGYKAKIVLPPGLLDGGR